VGDSKTKELSHISYALKEKKTQLDPNYAQEIKIQNWNTFPGNCLAWINASGGDRENIFLS